MEEVSSRELSSAWESPTFGEDSSFDLDKPVGSMSISPCGRDIVLASRQGLHVVDLDSPFSPPRHLPHHTPWEVADVQWSPFPVRDYWVVSTSNQKALVWNLAMLNPEASIEHVLHAHSRAITDINFSAFHPDILATCAVDSYIHCWDLRHPRKPAITFCDWFAGATQVKWNRQNPHIIASSHDRFLRIWDDRKGAYPLSSIEAHDTKIYGLDWNRTSPTRLTTCSLDRTIKFWNYVDETQQPEYVIKTRFPVWRARHTPFGHGVTAMPQRGNNDLHLYGFDLLREDVEQITSARPVHQFSGHKDQVKEFLWRPRGEVQNSIDNREFQLVSWGADRVLRLHRADDQILRKVGYEKGKKVNGRLHLTRKNATYKSYRDDPIKSGHSPQKGALSSVYSRRDAQVEVGWRSGLSLGISKAPIMAANTWENGFSMSSRLNKNVKVQRKDIDPIAWMKGVKIGKRESGMDQSAASIMSPNLRAARNWETFESLGEEITHVGDKFSKVTFEEINVQRRFVKLAMSGPWGKAETVVFFQCLLSFPRDYPQTATPGITVEKTTLVDVTAIKKLEREFQVIANIYMSHQRGSLEALVRYLQGEQTVNEILSWTKAQSTGILGLPTSGDESSSDEEDDEGNDYNGVRIEDTGLSGSGLLSISNANTNVPLPKACGAVWAENGRLVCFFPPKEDNMQSLLGSLGLRGSEIAKGRGKHFAGFGRLQLNPPDVRLRPPGLDSIDSGDSGTESDSDDSYASSSSSSASSKELTLSYAWRAKPLNAPRIDSVMDNSQMSSGSLNKGRSTVLTKKNTVSIHTYEEFLPAKRQLAEGYVAHGSNACKYNAKVAEAANNQVLADAWALLDMILHDEVPVHELKSTTNGTSVNVVTPRLLKPLQVAGKSLHESSKIGHGLVLPVNSCSAVKWGQHPLGGNGVIKNLFLYFEHLGDIQMLAMMSCVLVNSNIMDRAKRLPKPINSEQSSNPKLRASSTRNESLISLTNLPQVQHDYFPFPEVALSLLRPTQSVQSRPQPSRRVALNHPSAASSLGASNSDPMNSFSSGNTPPTSVPSGRRGLGRVGSNSLSLSTSPEHLRQSHRSNSNLSTTYSSFKGQFTFSTSTSPSPPISSLKKSISPLGTFVGGSTSIVTRGPNSVFRHPFGANEETKSLYSVRYYAKGHGVDAGKEPKIKINLKHQDEFHNEGYARVAHLDPNEEWYYQAYRVAYAHLLSVWEMPLAKTEVLKYGKRSLVAIQQLRDATDGPKPVVISIGRNSDGSAIIHLRNTLSTRRKCTACNKSREPFSSMHSFRCGRCASKEAALFCVYCAERVHGHATPCLNCGHVVHSQCRSTLLSPSSLDEEPDFGLTCSVGCGCECSGFECPDIELPQEVPIPPSIQTSIIEEAEEQLGWHDREGAWEDVAYESLAKNLGSAGARYVKPKASQIWRGVERKETHPT